MKLSDVPFGQVFSLGYDRAVRIEATDCYLNNRDYDYQRRGQLPAVLFSTGEIRWYKSDRPVTLEPTGPVPLGTLSPGDRFTEAGDDRVFQLLDDSIDGSYHPGDFPAFDVSNNEFVVFTSDTVVAKQETK